jgi:hypothetical protein
MNSTVKIKHGDKTQTFWRATNNDTGQPIDLTGATEVRLILQKRPRSLPIFPTITVIDPTNGVVEWVTDGSLAIGVYNVELEITMSPTERVTAPNCGYETLEVCEDLA